MVSFGVDSPKSMWYLLELITRPHSQQYQIVSYRDYDPVWHVYKQGQNYEIRVMDKSTL